MADIQSNINVTLQRIKSACEEKNLRPPVLLAISKTRSPAELVAAYEAGIRHFGENYLQEAMGKITTLAELPLSWHFIGRLQSNKTQAVASHFDWVHTLESEKHAHRLSRQRPAHKAPLNICIQVNTSGEPSKGGIAPEQVTELLHAITGLPGLRVRGLMTIPAPARDIEQQRLPFHLLRELLTSLQTDHPMLDTLSMGMSGDLEAAIAEGATIVRIGTALFGPRTARHTA